MGAAGGELPDGPVKRMFGAGMAIRGGTVMRPGRVAILLLALGVAVSGCQLPGQLFAFFFAPRHPKKTVKAEYKLASDRLVIVPYAGTDILFTYPAVPLEVSHDILNEIYLNLRPRVKAAVRPVDVVRWQESNLEWPNMALEDIAKTFQADTVLYVELERYTMLEERSANLFRGRVRARVQVVKAEAKRNPVYETIVETVFPEDRPVGVLEVSERKIRAAVTRIFARDVVRKFHDHEVEDRGGRK